MIGRLLSLWRTLVEVWLLADRTNLMLIAAGCGFYGIFSMFPALAAVIAIFGLVSDPSVVNDQVQILEEFLPTDAYALIRGQIDVLLSTRTDALALSTFVSLAVAIWSARAAVSALVVGLNAIHGRPNRSGLRHVMVSILLTIGLIAVAISALMAVVVAPIAIALLPFSPATAQWLETVRWLVALVSLWFAIGLLYRFGPNRRGNRPGLVSPGGIIVVASWLAASLLFTLYVNNFASYNEVYGGIGAVIGLMMWMFISAWLLLMGAALNVVVLDGGHAADARDPVAGSGV